MTDLLELIRSLLGTVPVGYEFLEYIVLFFLLLFGLFIISVSCKPSSACSGVRG